MTYYYQKQVGQIKPLLIKKDRLVLKIFKCKYKLKFFKGTLFFFLDVFYMKNILLAF